MPLPFSFSGSDSDSSEVHINRMLQILKEFSADPILSSYVIDDVWDYMVAMKVCKCDMGELDCLQYFGKLKLETMKRNISWFPTY